MSPGIDKLRVLATVMESMQEADTLAGSGCTARSDIRELLHHAEAVLNGVGDNRAVLSTSQDESLSVAETLRGKLAELKSRLAIAA